MISVIIKYERSLQMASTDAVTTKPLAVAFSTRDAWGRQPGGGPHVDGSDGDDTANRTGVSSRPAAWDVAELLFFLAIALVAARTGATYICHQGPGGSGRFGSSTGERFSIADEILG